MSDIDVAEVRRKVRDIIADRLDMVPGDVTDDAMIAGDLGADSLAAIEIVISLEEEFDIDIPDEDIPTEDANVPWVATYIVGRLAEKMAATSGAPDA